MAARRGGGGADCAAAAVVVVVPTAGDACRDASPAPSVVSGRGDGGPSPK